MCMKRALITGVSGQDGRHLSQFLLAKGYEVFGIVREQSQIESLSLESDFSNLRLLAGDLRDKVQLIRLLELTHPDEIYNLAAFSSVSKSFEYPEIASNVTGLGTLNLLQAIRETGLHQSVKVYQASSSEMFGQVSESPQSELTIFNPRSPYGVAKVFAHQTCVNYREDYGLHVSCGIMFNHEGPHRGSGYVTRKITQSVARIKLGKIDKFSLGDISSQRDWGFAGDYVRAMWLMLQQEVPDDYVIATGKSHSVSEFVELAFIAAGIQNPPSDFLLYDTKLMRPNDRRLLVGDYSKAREKLGWEPSINFEELVKLMVENDLKLESASI